MKRNSQPVSDPTGLRRQAQRLLSQAAAAESFLIGVPRLPVDHERRRRVLFGRPAPDRRQLLEPGEPGHGA